MDSTFWHGKRVFLTGHTGFKGSWLSLWLEMLGAQVWGYSLPITTQPNLFGVAEVARGLHSLTGDLADLETLQRAICAQGTEIVIHLAAQSLVRQSYQDPVETFATNVLGTVHLLEAVRHAPTVRVVLVVTSDKCYDNREWPWGYRENDPMGGWDPYSASKGCAELVVDSYRRSFFDQKEAAPAAGVAVASARAGNVIGGGDWAKDRLVPDMIRAFSQKHPVLIRRPHAVRPWQHVLEPLFGYLLLVERLWSDGTTYAHGWNFGPNPTEMLTVAAVTEQLVRLWGKPASWSTDQAAVVHEAGVLRLDSGLAHSKLGWIPKLSVAESIRWTVEWYQAFYHGSQDMRALTLAQIDRYQQRQANDDNS